MILDNCRSRESSQRLIKNASQSFSDDENGSSFQAPRSTLVNIFMIADTKRYTYVYIYTHKMVIICIYIYTFLYVFIFISGMAEVGRAGSTQKQRSRPPLSAKSIDFLFFVFVATSGKLTKPLKALGFVASRCFFWPSNLPPPVGTEHISPIEVPKLDDFPGKYPS